MFKAAPMGESWTRESVRARIAEHFAAELRDEVLTVLDRYPGDTPGGRARVQLAVLASAAGSLSKVHDYVAHANLDFRDVLYWAEHDRRDTGEFDEALRACEAALRRAQLEGDADALERLVDDDLVFTGPDGAVFGKADDLDAHRQGWVRITRLDPSEERIQRFGHVVVVSVRMEMAGTFRGARFEGPFRYTRVWCRRPDGWRVVAGHVSVVSA